RARKRYVFAFPREGVEPMESPNGKTRIELTAPPKTWVTESVLALLRHFWSDAFFGDAISPELKFLRDPQVLASIRASRNIVAHRGFGSLTADEKGGPTWPRNRVLYFFLEGESSASKLQHLTLVCDEQTEEIERLQRSLEETLWANAMASQTIPQAA
ncbi:MAG TPA: hypothetical protein VG097_03915, partial [Gemmata sp.]|nr:hypothetical protein [Gemmata sp.]